MGHREWNIVPRHAASIAWEQRIDSNYSTRKTTQRLVCNFVVSNTKPPFMPFSDYKLQKYQNLQSHFLIRTLFFRARHMEKPRTRILTQNVHQSIDRFPRSNWPISHLSFSWKTVQKYWELRVCNSGKSVSLNSENLTFKDFTRATRCTCFIHIGTNRQDGQQKPFKCS